MQDEPVKPFLRADQTLLIGLGGHKCASSWLFGYLKNHPDCFGSSQKELDHFADFGVLGNLWRIRARLKTAIDAINSFRDAHPEVSSETLSIEKLLELSKLHSNIHDLASNAASLTMLGKYELNFQHVEESAKVILDISPSYSLEGLHNLEQMQKAHTKTRFIFLMRDPAERTLSAYKYNKKMLGQRVAKSPARRLRFLAEFLSTKKADQHTYFDIILQSCDQHIPSGHMHTEFYENLFNDASIKKICDFLDIDFWPGNYNNFIHKTDVGGNEVELSDIEREFLVDRYYHVYEYIDERFGLDAPDEWNWPKDIKTRRLAQKNAGSK